MALIKCPECGERISEQAKECTNCGYPIQDWLKTLPPAKAWQPEQPGGITSETSATEESNGAEYETAMPPCQTAKPRRNPIHLPYQTPRPR